MVLGVAGYAAAVVAALVRLVFIRRRWETAVREWQARERELHAQGRNVRLAGAPREVIEIGRGHELATSEASIVANDFDLIADDGERIHVARGRTLETHAHGILRLDDKTDLYAALAGEPLLFYDEGDAGIMLTDRDWAWAGFMHGVCDPSPKAVAVVAAIFASLLGLAVWRDSLGWWIPALLLLALLAWDQLRAGGDALYDLCRSESRIWARLEAE